ncbi:MAG: filamentous hemagglutinin N-terminal domain-containing protein [Xenococcaceae cyanobacterium]
MKIQPKTVKIILFAFLICLLPLPTKAQEITPDGTTATEVTTLDGSNFDIGGGDSLRDSSASRAGGNLFHSFGNFGVTTGGSANFLNSPDVENIINRVTGGNVSSIDGLIKANGGANLFLINPAGIIFGQNARLDIGGSFLGNTADSLLFNDGTEFSAVNATGKPLLTINAPIGLNFRNTPADIQVQGNGKGTRTTTDLSDLIDTTDALRVNSDKTFALVGGNLNFDGATIKTAGGRLELGSVAGGKVSLNPVDKGWSLGYEEIPTFGNIELFKQATVDASGLGAGDVRVQGKNIKLADGSQLEASTIGNIDAEGGSIKVNASDTVSLDGISSDGRFYSGIGSSLGKQAEGKAANIDINTGNLVLTNGAGIFSSNLGKGDGENITINASNTVFLEGRSSAPKPFDDSFYSGIGSVLYPGTEGKAGKLEINTANLVLTNGAGIFSSNLGKGDEGNITINASDKVSLISNFSSERIDIIRRRPYAFLSGIKAGKIEINTGNLALTNGAQVSTNTRSFSTAGTLNINASKSVVLSGLGSK